MDTFLTILIGIIVIGFPMLLLSTMVLVYKTEPNCHTGGDRHKWYNQYGDYMHCGRDEGNLPGQRTCPSNNGLYNKERGWDYRMERHCLACDRHEYHAGYAPTGKLDEKGKPETATVWKVKPGHEGHINNYGYANYHTPGQRYDADGYRI